MRRTLPPVLVAIVLVTAAVRVEAVDVPSVCYRLPFNNPNLNDGWGSTCCGRTSPHRGLDFPKPAGTAIPVVADGVVALRTSTGCLGNVVVVEHADGMFSGYSHMQAASPLAPGAVVTRGQTIGAVGSTGTCTTGAHLHLTISPERDGYKIGTTVDPHRYILDHLTCDHPAGGVLDEVACGGVAGTVQDPDTPTTSLTARVAFGGDVGASDSIEVEVPADVLRAPSCAPTDACAHGFRAPVPPALMDDAAHDVFAYAVDAQGRLTLLAGAPASVSCPPPPLPEVAPGSVRRAVSDEVLAAWGLGVADVVAGRATELATLPAAAPVVAPVLIALPRAEPPADAPAGAPDLYVRDGDVLRPVADDATLVAWHLDELAAAVLPAEGAARDALAGLVVGVPWPSAPYLARDDDGVVQLVDAPPPLWAVLVLDASGAPPWPDVLETDAHVTIDVVLRNRGSLSWQEDVTLVAASSNLCAPAWDADDDGTACRVAARVDGTVGPGASTSLRVPLVAPSSPGTVSLCLSLRQGRHAFGAPGQGGPADDAWCHDVEVVARRAPSDDDARQVPAGVGGCTSTGAMPSVAGLLALLAVVGAPSRRRSRPSSKVFEPIA